MFLRLIINYFNGYILLNILDNKEYKKMRNNDITSALLIPTLYIYILKK